MKNTLKDSRTGGVAVYKTTVETEFCGDFVKLSFDCENSVCYCPYEENNAPIYKGDVCEAFLCADETRKEYLETEVAPNGTVFAARIINEDGKLSPQMLDNVLFDVQVEKTGTGYKAEYKIDLKKVGMNGKKLVGNLFRIDTDGGESNKHLFALSPTLCGTFHKPEKFIALN